MMLSLGMFVFSLHTLAYQEFQRQTEWRHASSSRIGAQPARQFVGRGDDAITLPGVLLPELAGSALSLDVLRQMADTGSAWPMVEGTGRIYGLWVIERVTETRTLFFADGTRGGSSSPSSSSVSTTAAPICSARSSVPLATC